MEEAVMVGVLHWRRIGRLTLVLVPLVGLAACEKPDPQKVRERLHLPGPDFVADIARGKQLFAANCARCHGVAGRGTDQGPPLVDQTYRPSHHGDLVFHMAVKNGARQHHWGFGDMPPVPGLSPEDVGHIIAYVRAEQRKAGIR